ncbi:THAP domain-containing protein 11-like [Coccinella septempunctata]|uniref:THAP domain-containing protein 11-like n=1 Tax=Coccinella septempunctata TaxID=41139 RepID=UPI001D093BC0|nr:THAP domain-containing protein 11-like [Coccinella septempunctata]
MSEQGNSTKKKTLYNCNCCVYNCSSRKGKSRAIHFHKFPKEDASTVHITNSLGMLEKVDRRKEWIKRLLMGKPVTNNMRVCSLHFQDSDYIATGSVLQHMKAPKLKVTAVPSRNLPERKFSKALNRASIERRKQRLEKRSAISKKNPKNSTSTIDFPKRLLTFLHIC